MTTINLQVAAGADDTRESSSGSCSHTGNNTLQETAASVPAYGAFRWAAAIPQGSTIDSATLTLYPTTQLVDDPITTVFGLDADTVAAFDSTDNEITSYASTTATVAWNGSSVGFGAQTIIVTTIVQEIVNRAGWTSGNYLGMAVRSETGCNVRITLYEGDSAEAAKLDVTFTEPAGAAVSKTSRVRLTSMVGGRLTG